MSGSLVSAFLLKAKPMEPTKSVLLLMLPFKAMLLSEGARG
jgi:hypothetical protein